MKTAALLAIFTAVSAVCAYAQRSSKPAFAQYRTQVERPRIKEIDFKKNPAARSFRTRLSEGVRGGVNFAGHYTVVGWGCGTGCISGAIVDLDRGKVLWPEQLNGIGVWYFGDSYADEPVAYRKNSRLLVITGSPGVLRDAPEKPSGVYYYEWKNDRLQLVRFEKKDTGK